MKILIINGSPKKRGLISQMLDIMRVEAENRGDSVETVYTNDLNVKPCIGCMVCRTKNKCVDQILRRSRKRRRARGPGLTVSMWRRILSSAMYLKGISMPES